MSKSNEFAMFLAKLAELGAAKNIRPFEVVNDAQELQLIARRLHRIGERQCNGYANYLGENWEKRDERSEERAEKRARAIAAKYGLALYYQTDPRGWPLYLGVGITDQNYNSTGLGVPL